MTYVSLYEGFGLPIATAVGWVPCPTVTSNVFSMHELARERPR